MPAMMCSSVLLPEPDGPISDRNSPRAMSRLTSSSAAISISPWRYTFERLRMETIGCDCTRHQYARITPRATHAAPPRAG